MRDTCRLFVLVILLFGTSIVCRADYASGNAPFINSWLVLGAFDNDAPNSGLDAHQIDESNAEPVEGQVVARREWRYFDDRLFSRNFDDYQDLFSYYRVKLKQPTAPKTVYAHVYVYSPTQRPGQLRLGADSSAKAWFNGRLILSHSGPGNCSKDDLIHDISLESGWNRLLVKIGCSASIVVSRMPREMRYRD
jgi:hypothetical protein